MKISYYSRFLKQVSVLAVTLLLFSTSACDSGFGSLNTDPTTANSLDAPLRFTNVQLRASEGRFEAWRGNLIYSSCMIQHLASTITAWAGDRYTINNAYASAFWDSMYPNAVKGIEDIISDIKDNPELVNQYAQARIMRVFIYHRLTDLYGDIPYSEAGKGFIDGISKPVYDPQSEIYADMINELTEAVNSMDPNLETFGTNDILFAGDIDRWTKFGNSLKLRLGMRLSEVDAATAENTVREAIQGGVMTSNDDIAYIRHFTGPSGLNRYGAGEVFQDFGIGGHGFRMSDNMMELLLDSDNGGSNIDPRATILSAVYNEDGEIASSDPADFQGFPNGLTSSEIGQLETFTYNQPHREYMVSYSSPNLFQTYGEVEFLLAEAALRNWGAPSTAQEHYENGIRASMKHLTLYGAPEISDTEINDYIANAPAANMEQVLTQKWLTLFLNGYEAFAEWRRTGFPQLEPVNFPGNQTGGTIPRRLIYPVSEPGNNGENYQTAVGRQGPDALTTRVWWDAE